MKMKKNPFNFPLIILVLYIQDSLNIYIHCWLNREFHTYYTNIVMNRKKNRTLHAPFLCSNGFNGAKNAYFGISKVPLIYWWYTFIHLWMVPFRYYSFVCNRLSYIYIYIYIMERHIKFNFGTTQFFKATYVNWNDTVLVFCSSVPGRPIVYSPFRHPAKIDILQ